WRRRQPAVRRRWAPTGVRRRNLASSHPPSRPLVPRGRRTDVTTTVTTRADALTAAMDHAVTLAERGGSAGGNPRVGCVIVDAAGSARASGFHRGAGSPHAEIAALRSLPRLSPAELAEITMVVTLEPCRHHGRTPPCTEAI